MNDSLTRFRAGIVFALTTALSLLIIKFMKLVPVGVDDANILFVYSKHLAMGEGLVYNIGGERVEGFSSMAWMLLTAPGYLLSDFPYALFLALNVLLVGSALSSALLFIEARSSGPMVTRFIPFSLSGLIFLAWFIASPSFFIWTVNSLLETGLWAALLLVTTVQLLKVIARDETTQRDIWMFAFLLAAQLLTRPEAFAWALTFGALLLLTLRAQGVNGKSLIMQLGLVAGFAALTFGLLVLFRLWYFGYPLPNTYYAKVTPDKLYNLRFGAIYLIQFVQASPVIAPIILLALIGALRNLSAALRTVFTVNNSMGQSQLTEFALSGIVLSGLTIPVLMGGDIFGAYRFYQPLWPMFILLVICFRYPDSWRFSWSPVASLSIFAAAVLVITYTNSVRWPALSKDPERVVHLFELSARQMRVAKNLHTLFAGTEHGLPSVGASAAGGIKIVYRGNVVDTMGLNFTPMAHHDGDKKGVRGHAAFDEGVFWEHAPLLFEPQPCPRKAPLNRIKDPHGWWYRIYRGLTDDERFQQHYAHIVIDIPDNGEQICTYMDRAWLTELQADGSYSIQQID